MPNTEYQRRIDAVNRKRQERGFPPITPRQGSNGLEFYFNNNWFGCDDEAALITLERYPYWEREAA